MDNPLEKLEPEDKISGMHSKNDPLYDKYTENQSIYSKENIINKVNEKLSHDNNTENKYLAYETIEKEYQEENENNNRGQISNSYFDKNNSARKYSNEIEVIISNVQNQNFNKKDYHYVYKTQRGGSGSYKKNENNEINYHFNQDTINNKNDNFNNQTSNFASNLQGGYGTINQPNFYSNNNFNTNQTNQNSNYRNNNNFHYGSYYNNSSKNKSKSQNNKEIVLNQNNMNNNNLNYNFNNNSINNNVNSNFNCNSTLNNNTNQNPNYIYFQNNNKHNENYENINCNFILQVDDHLSHKNKKNKTYNKMKSKKMSKQNNFVNSYEKTNDFSFSKIFMNLNLKFLKQTYKIRDLNFVDYEMDNMRSDKNRKIQKKTNEINNFLFANGQDRDNFQHNAYNTNFVESQNDNYNSNNKNSSSEEMPTLNFINPYFFNNSQNQALNMYNFNVLNQHPNILHQNLNINSIKHKNNLKNNNNNLDPFNFSNNNLHNFKNLGHIQNPDINYLSDENFNYDEKLNFNNYNLGKNNMNVNLPLDNPLNQLRLHNQMQMNQNNFYENMQMQNFNTYINDPKILEENILNGRFLTGVIRINKCHTHGYITVPGLYNDILIRGNRNLNQSLHLDEVIVELFPVVCWKPLFNKKIRKISYNNPKDDSAQQNILNMIRNEAANKNLKAAKEAKTSLEKEILIPENKKKRREKNNRHSSDKKQPEKHSDSKQSKIDKKIENVDLIKSEDKYLMDVNSSLASDQKINLYKVENTIEDKKLREENKDKTDNHNKINKKESVDQKDYLHDDSDDLSDSEPSDDDSQDLPESEEEDNLGLKVNSNIEKNYLSDDDKDDDEEYQLSEKKIIEMNYNHQNYIFEANYGFSAETSKFKENFTTLEERLIYINQLCNLRPEGRIVKILRSPNLEKNQIVKIVNEKSLIFACPIDENIPKIFIKMKKFRRMEFLRKLEHDHVFKNKYFLVRIVGWALNFKCPKGIIVNELGNSGDIEVETEVLLRTYEVDYPAEYPHHIQEQIKKFENWTVPESTIKKRHDLRNELIYTVDPKHSKDLDDAISCKLIDAEKGLLEIGVHIADPSYFIPKGSLIDKEALNRTTTVYLVHRNIPMLPRLLSDNVISLLPFKDRLAFSCTFRIYFDGALDLTFQPKFHLSVVNSAAKWNYELAQRIINNEPVEYEELSEEAGTKPKTREIFEKLCDSVRMLHKLTKLVRSQRIESGSLVIENDELVFDLNQDNMPVNFRLKKKLDSHYMIEELMLIANKLSAEFIYDNVKDFALIRKHPLLNDSKFQEIQRYLTVNNMVVDFEDSQALNEMLFKLEKKDKNKYICVQHKLKNFMQRAEYTITKDKDISELKHSALNFDLYTHFTSPIRRYPDLVVHRQLKYILNKMGLLEVKREKVECFNKEENTNDEKDQVEVKEQESVNQVTQGLKDITDDDIDEANYNFKHGINEDETKGNKDSNSISLKDESDVKPSSADNILSIMIFNVLKKLKENEDNTSEKGKEVIQILKQEEIKDEEICDSKEYENDAIVNYEKYVDHFNEKYYNGKMISSKCQKLFQCIFLKNVPNENYTALIIDISNKIPMKNKRLPQQNSFDTQTLVISLFIPKLNLEFDWKKDDNNNIINYKFNSETSVSIDYKDEEDQNVHNKILRTFDEIKVNIIPIDTIPIDIKCTITFS